MAKKKILLINDMCGYGKVASAAMLPILSYMGHVTYNLPTALVSNTLDYGKFNLLDTTDYIMGVFPVWKELGFRFDYVFVCSVTGSTQAGMVIGFAAETGDLEAQARAKLARKGCDWIVANDVSPATAIMGGHENAVTLISDAGAESWPRLSKPEVARRLADRIADQLAGARE